MARGIATCTCATCGKQFEKIVFRSKRSEADSWVAWAERNYDQCPDCWKAAQEAVAKAEAEKAGLPELTGSPKQIAWAERIRHRIWTDYTEYEDRCRQFAEQTGYDMEVFAAEVAKCREVFSRITSAKDYIVHQDDMLSKFLDTYMESK